MYTRKQIFSTLKMFKFSVNKKKKKSREFCLLKKQYVEI